MVVGNTCEIAGRELCEETYAMVRNHQSIGSRSDVLTYPSAKKYVQRLLAEAPKAKDPIQRRLAVVTGAIQGSVGYHVAEELAVAAGMDVVLVGRSSKKLEAAARSIQGEFKRRHTYASSEETSPKLYRVRMNTNSLQSVTTAAEEIEIISKRNYEGQVHVAAVMGGEVSDHYSSTEEGVEVNLGRNYLAPRLLAGLLLPYLRAAATNDYKPRLIQEASVGHCVGADFNPFLLQKSPKEGGAAEFTIVKNEETGKLEYAFPEAGLEMYYRSKMALMTDALGLAREEPMLAVVACDPGLLSFATAPTNASPASRKSLSSRVLDLSPSQAARSALRAALDPAFNTTEMHYLHSDGNPWRMVEPTALDCDLEEHAEIVRSVVDELSGQLVTDKDCEWELWSAEESSSSMLGHWSPTVSPAVSPSVSPAPALSMLTKEKMVAAVAPPPFATASSAMPSRSSILQGSSAMWGRSFNMLSQ